MTLEHWVMIYLADFILWLWVFKLGGDETLGDTPISGIFIFVVTLKWRELSADGLRVYLSIIFAVHTLFFILGITVPAFRAMLG